jgi:hypothetical protein
MGSHSILAPVLALIGWTMAVMVWMMATRLIAFERAGITPGSLPPGTRGPDLDSRLDPHAQWKSHNYNHLVEQPTVFYALCLTIAATGLQTGASVPIAWAYVGLRVAHSIVQSTVNIVRYRAMLFVLSSLLLLILTVVTLCTAFASS